MSRGDPPDPSMRPDKQQLIADPDSDRIWKPRTWMVRVHLGNFGRNLLGGDSMPSLRACRRVAFLALLFVAAGSSTGRASVKCLSNGTSTGLPHVLVVFPRFSTPRPGQCTELAGYEASTSLAWPTSATACLNSAGSRIYIGVTVRPLTHAPLIPGNDTLQKLLGFDLPYPVSTGGVVDYESFGVGGTQASAIFDSDASLAPCHPSAMP
jgi:hypothetical protein